MNVCFFIFYTFHYKYCYLKYANILIYLTSNSSDKITRLVTVETKNLIIAQVQEEFTTF